MMLSDRWGVRRDKRGYPPIPPKRALIGAIYALFMLPLGACTDDPEDPGIVAEIGDGAYTIHIDKTGVSLGRGSAEGAPLLHIPPSGFTLGTVDALDDNTNYDPYGYELNPIFAAPGLLYSPPSKFEPQPSTDGKHADVMLTYPNGVRAQVSFDLMATGRFAAKWSLLTADAPVAFFRLGADVDANEAFYGLGAYFDDVNHRGKLRAMQIEPDGSSESSYNEAHSPIPLLIGTRGWGLFVASRRPGMFAVATSRPDWVEATYGTGLGSAAEGLEFHLFGAERPLDITRHYYDITGYPRLPARWALGPLVWRDENDDQAQVESDITMMRTLDLAASGYWIDRPYATEVNTFDFNPNQFPDAPGMIKKLHDLGYRTALWHAPYLSDKSPATQALRDEATQKGYYPLETGILLNKWGLPLDLTVPEAMKWWQSHLKAYTDMGVEGFKLDYGEDVVIGTTAQRIDRWKFHDGSDERTMHDIYGDLYHRAYAEVLPAEGGLLLIRHGAYGDQKNGGVFWPGDEDTGFALHGQEVMSSDGTSYVAVGGLPASIVYGLSLGPSGYPFYGSDTGGYRHTPPTPECFIRWFEQTALSTVMQIGTSANTVAWELFNAKTDPDGSLLGLYRSYTRLHLRLFPYEWTYAQNIAKDGRPITRALGLAYPEIGSHPSDIYLFGDDLLVAPVVTEGAVKRSVTFPPGTWIDWWDGSSHKGPATEEVDAPLEKLPLYMRQGGIIPMLRPTIDTLAPTTMPAEVDSYATSAGPLWVRVAPGEKSTFTVFDGTELTQELSDKTITLSASDGSEFSSGFVFELIAAGKKPASVSTGAAPLAELPTLDDLTAAQSGWVYAQNTIYIKVPAGKQSVTVTLQ